MVFEWLGIESDPPSAFAAYSKRPVTLCACANIGMLIRIWAESDTKLPGVVTLAPGAVDTACPRSRPAPLSIPPGIDIAVATFPPMSEPPAWQPECSRRNQHDRSQ